MIKQCPSTRSAPEECDWYAYLQGTSMASPHATGVAALAVSQFGTGANANTFGLSPDVVRTRVMDSARNHACPAGGVKSCEDVGRSAEFTAKCTGTTDFNSFYGPVAGT